MAKARRESSGWRHQRGAVMALKICGERGARSAGIGVTWRYKRGGGAGGGVATTSLFGWLAASWLAWRWRLAKYRRWRLLAPAALYRLTNTTMAAAFGCRLFP